MQWLLYATFVCTATAVKSEHLAENTDFETVEVMVNDVATLQCNVGVTPAVDKITLIIWYKNSSSVPIYSVDMRERHQPEHADHWSDKKIMEGRARFNFDRRSLAIEHVRSSDEGLYICRIDFKQSPTKYFEIQLIVVIPIQNITILEAIQDSELTDHSFVLPAIMEGNSLTATCTAIGGNPKPNVHWWRNDELLDQTFEFFEDKATNILFLERVGRKNVDDKLSCRATNSKLTKMVTAAVSVNLYLLPENVVLSGTNDVMSAGHQYEITCRVVGSRPPANVSWLKNSETLSTPVVYSLSSDRKTVTSTLTLTANESDSGKILTCVASNRYFPNQTITDSRTLKVNYAPVVAINLGSNLNSSSIREGADVYFECHIRADPWITKIKWLHDNRQVTKNASTGVIISNQTLVLQSVTRQSSGYYRCAASNSEGESVSKPLSLDVKYEPVCRANQQRVYGAERNEEIDITCQVDGNPPPSWFRWSFNNSMVHMVPVDNFLNENGVSVIRYRPSIEAQYGTLLCSSRNDLGPQVVPCVFHVVSAGRPDAPHNCSVVNLTQNWLFVKCLRGFDGGLPQKFICEVAREWNDKVVSNITSKSRPEFRVTGLEARTSYAVVIYSANVKGKSKENVLLRVTTLPNVTEQSRRSMGRSSAVLNSYWSGNVIIVVATVASAIIVVLVVVSSQIIVTRKRKKRRHQSEEIRKVELSRGSLTHSEDDRNPDLIPQSTAVGLTYPLVSSISVQTSTSGTDNSILPIIRKSSITNATYLEASRLKELMWPPTKWPASVEPIMLVLPETIPTVSRLNAETQTPGSPISRKESTV